MKKLLLVLGISILITWCVKKPSESIDTTTDTDTGSNAIETNTVDTGSVDMGDMNMDNTTDATVETWN